MTSDEHRWIERFVRVFVDFLAIQYAAAIALVVGGLDTGSSSALIRVQSEASSLHYYSHVLLPLSVIFLVFNAAAGLYTKSRGYTLQYKLRRAATSSLLSAAVVSLI